MDQLFALDAPSWDGAWELRLVSASTASDWIGRYHYLGKRNTSSSEFGVFAPDMIAVVSIGNPSNAHGVAEKFGLSKWKGNKEITRVAVHPDSPRNTASRAIAMVLHELGRNGFDWVFSYADTGQGHHGGIYQALNGIYLGQSAARPGYLLNGEPIHPRSVVSRYGTQAREVAPKIAAERGETLVFVRNMNSAKHLYVLPTGDKASRRAIRRHLAPMVQPYPKRG